MCGFLKLRVDRVMAARVRRVGGSDGRFLAHLRNAQKWGRKKSKKRFFGGDQIYFLPLQASIEMFRKRFGPVLVGGFSHFVF